VTKKLLTKIESLLSEKSSSKPCSTADAEIFIVHRLLLPNKPLTRTRTLGRTNHQRSQVLRLTLTSCAHIDYCWLRNRWRELGPWDPKIIQEAQFYGWRWNHKCKYSNAGSKTFDENWDPGTQKSSKKPSSTADADIFCAQRLLVTEKPLTKTQSLLSQKSSSKSSSTADAEIFNVHRLLLAQKPLTKTRTLGPKKHPRSQVLRLTMIFSAHIDYCWLRNRWRKQSPCCPKNHPWNPVLRLTLKSSMYVDYCRLRNRWQKLGPWDPQIIQEAKFYGWQWRVLRT